MREFHLSSVSGRRAGGLQSLVFVYTITILTSAFLLMLIQPLFARLILPLMGGAPAVWNTVQLFFQTLLLLGYLYAHGVQRWCTPRQQVVVHLLLLLVPLLVLPIAIPPGWQPPATANPIGWVLLLLLVAVGLPFFAVSASSPLLQAWFSRTDHPDTANPYFLYAASNAGSVLGLLSYPVLIEPRLRLVQQSQLWSFGYGVLIVCFALCGFLLWRHGTTRIHQQEISASSITPITWKRRLRWLLLAAVPSSLSLSVTTFLSTDLSPFPLLWIIPLTLYLATFMIVFSRRMKVGTERLNRLAVLAIVALATLTGIHIAEFFWFVVIAHVSCVTMIILALHAALAADKPPATQLTEFFVWMSLGGALGGAFNALVAPVVFNTVFEYPLGVILALVLVSTPSWKRPTLNELGFIVVVPLVALTILLFRPDTTMVGFAAFGMLLGHTILMRKRQLALLIAVIALIFGGRQLMQSKWQPVEITRSFFGITKVAINADNAAIAMLHGTTMHGAQHLNMTGKPQPTTYYHPDGPLGQVMQTFPHQSLGAIGLGTGSVACYQQPGDRITYFEIDPEVVRLARDAGYFSYLSACAPDATIVLGDGRLMLAEQPDAKFDMLVADAFSSDAIPVHLITREAIQLYMQKVKPNGVLAVHISNRHLNLSPVIANTARELGLTAYQRMHSVKSDMARLETPSHWVILARDAATLTALSTDPRWEQLTPRPDFPTWSDDYAPIISAMK